MGWIIGKGIGVPFRMGSSQNWSSYWTQRGLGDYIARLQDEGGSIGDNTVMQEEVIPALSYLNKIDLWINPSFGKIEPLTEPLTPSVFFTFDDCYYDVYLNVFNEFKTRGIKGTMCISSSPVYIAESLPRLNPAPPTGDRMIWSEILDMKDYWDIIDHSYSHLGYQTLTRIEKEADLDSVDAIWQAHGLGLPKHFAYPGGIENLWSWKIISNRGRKLKRNTLNSIMQYSAVSLNRLPVRSFITFDDSNVTAFKSDIDTIKSLNSAVGFISHGLAAGSETSHYLEVVDYAIAQGVEVVTIDRLYRKINNIRGKYFSIVENNLFINDMFEYSPVVTKRIYFNDTLANITATVADSYVARGYEVGFMTDRTDAALAYVIPNTAFRTVLNATFYDSGLNSFSIGTGTVINHFDGYMKAYTNGYIVRFLSTRRLMGGKYVSGSYTALFDVNLAGGVITDWLSSFTFEFVLNAGQVEIWINGAKVVDVADATYSNGNILITSGYGGQINFKIIEITNFHDSGGLNDSFTDVSASELNYTQREYNIEDGLIEFETGLLRLEPTMGCGNQFGAIGIERIGSFSSFGTVMKFVSAARNNLKRIIEAGGNTSTSLAFDYNGKSITGSISQCGLHLLKNTRYLYLYNNKLTGTIPLSLNEINYVQTIRLDTNQISGYDTGAFLNKPHLTLINLDNNLLDADAVNKIAIDIRDNVNQYKMDGTLNLAGTGNAAPTGLGLVAVGQLQDAIAQLGAVANWTVTTN